MKDKNIIIVGGGPVGSVLALALQQQNMPFTMLEARAKGASHNDKRALALSYGSRLILEKLGVWQQIAAKATAINTIHISQRGGLGRTKLQASEHKMPALGYVLPYGALTQALDAALDLSQVQYDAEATQIKPGEPFAQVTFNDTKTLQSALIIVADGGRSLDEIDGIERETKEYGHDALVTKVRAELPHHNIAYERFTPTGPMALLPNGERDFSLVWTGLQANIYELSGLSDIEFLKQLHAAFGDRVGQFLSVEKRLCFPLKLSTLKPATAPHIAIIGNAAQTMHPVAGQGFNIGLRDAGNLAQAIDNNHEIGSLSQFQQYAKTRQADTRGGMLFTDFLVNVFASDLIGVKPLRGLGLGLLNQSKLGKQLLVERMSFGR